MFSPVLKQQFFGGHLLANCLIKSIRSSIVNFRELNKMYVCCSFKSLVDGQWSWNWRHRSQSIEIVPLLSCSKDKTQHQSLWQFQDVKSESKSTWLLRVLQCLPCHQMLIPWRFVHHIVYPLIFVGQGKPKGVGSLQRFLYLAIESLTLFVDDSIDINYRRRIDLVYR